MSQSMFDMPRGLFIEPGDNAVPHVLYDLSLPLAERKAKRQLFKTGADVANYMGVVPKKIFENRMPGKKIKRVSDGKMYAVRVASQQDIQELNKHKP